MIDVVRSFFERAYEELLIREIGDSPTHVAVIQDGNRRYAQQQGKDSAAGHRAGAKTTELVLLWCKELDVEELTLYAFSTENFNRPESELHHLYDLLCEKLVEFADSVEVHENDVEIRIIGELEQLPERVQQAAEYAMDQTAGYDRFKLNIALAYGGRAELLGAAQDIVDAVERGELEPSKIDLPEIEGRLYDSAVRNVDLIIRTGGDERTSNFLPWHANGNEAAVYFCTPYWPEFSKIDFLRAIRTYHHREVSWQHSRRQRARILVQALGESELPTATRILGSESVARDRLLEPDSDESRMEGSDISRPTSQ